MSRTVKLKVNTGPGLFPGEVTVSVLHYQMGRWCELASGHLPDTYVFDGMIPVEVLQYDARTVKIRLPFRSMLFGDTVYISRESCFS